MGRPLFVFLLIPTSASLLFSRCKSMNWRSISLRHGEVSVPSCVCSMHNVRFYLCLTSTMDTILKYLISCSRGLPSSDIQTSGQHITWCKVRRPSVNEESFGWLHILVSAGADSSIVRLVTPHCVCCTAACSMQCSRSSKTKFTACLSSTPSRGMHFIFSHTRGSIYTSKRPNLLRITV